MKNKNILAVQNLIRCLGIECLKVPEIVANLVRAFGIVQWGPPVFGEEEKFKNPSNDMAGIYQSPLQISKALVYLSDFQINSYLEVGVFQGGNFLFVSEYLRRFNPEIRCLGLDPTGYLNPEIAEIIAQETYLAFLPRMSDSVCGAVFDLVFIDGDHNREWVETDYANVGRHANICMIHDIQEFSCPDVVDFWKKIKDDNAVEFLDHSSPVPFQGIGILHQQRLE